MVGWGCHGWGARKKNSRSAAEMVAGEEVAAAVPGSSPATSDGGW